MKEVNTQEFDSLMSKSVRVRECPHCGHVAEIRIIIPMYGRTGARVECPNCHCQTANQGISDCLFENGGNKRLGTPITPEAMLSGVLEAIRLWNGSKKGGEQE